MHNIIQDRERSSANRSLAVSSFVIHLVYGIFTHSSYRHLICLSTCIVFYHSLVVFAVILVLISTNNKFQVIDQVLLLQNKFLYPPSADKYQY